MKKSLDDTYSDEALEQTRTTSFLPSLALLSSDITCLHALHDDGDALSPADTSRAHRILLLRSLQFMRQMGKNPCTGGGQWMAHGDGAAVRIGQVPI